MTGDHAGGGEVDRLLAGSTLTVDGDTGHGFWPAGGQQRSARDVKGLLAGLHDASPDDVVDDLRVDAGLLDESVEHLRGQVGRVYAGQPAVASADR